MRGQTPTGADRTHAHAATEAQRLHQELGLRAAVAVIILLFLSLVPFGAGGRPDPLLPLIALAGLLANLPYYVLARTGRWPRAQAHGRMLVDIGLITIGMWSAGGLAAAPYLGVYLVVVIYAGMVLSSTACVVATATATGCYLATVALDRLGGMATAPSAEVAELWAVAAFNLLVLNVAGGLTALLARALRESRQWVRRTSLELDNLMETIPDIIYVIDTSWALVLWNRRLEAVTGLTAAELERRSVLELFAPEDRAAVGHAVRRGLTHGRFGVEGRLLTRDGRAVDHEWTGAPLKDERGRVIGLTGIGHDVTERKQAEAALLQQEQEVRQLQKMEAVGRFAGGIAHDFNNLLTVLMGRGQLVARGLASDDPIRRELELIDETAQRGASLTRQLLAFSRKQVLQPTVLDLNPLVVSVGAMLRRFIGEDVELVIVPSARTGRIVADPTQIEQVLMNLAVNARDAMPRGGRLTIETIDVEVDETEARRRAGLEPGPYVLLAVTDTGVGMDAETRSRLFEPFFTTKEPGKGTGLGLSTVYGIVKQHDGWIGVQSAPGRGTRMEIYLPRSAAAVTPVTAASEPPRRGWETVLLAEDELEVRGLARDVLGLYGYTVLEACHGSEALEIAAGHAGPIHLLVTDVVMPQMGGHELVERLTAHRPGLYALYISGYGGDGIVPAVTAAEGRAFLPKPFTPDLLARTVREVLDAPAHTGREAHPTRRARRGRLARLLSPSRS